MAQAGEQLPHKHHRSVIADTWSDLRGLTPARIAIGRTGVSLPSGELLSQALAHSRAMDAVERPLDTDRLACELAALGLGTRVLHSRAETRTRYLVRPDLGRRVRPEDLDTLPRGTRPDIVFVVSDGLSAAAVQNHVQPLLEAVLPAITALTKAPIVIARQARVALCDEVGEYLGARLAVSLIGERPGLSSTDSLGIYITYGPRVGNTDEARNCISNVRPGGMTFVDASELLVRLIRLALGHGATGIALQAMTERLPGVHGDRWSAQS